MPMSEFGDQQLTDEDRGYAGSRFSEVVAALFANPYQRVCQGETPLPVYRIHFNHPTWRANRNDPSTATRIDGKKVG